MLTDKQDYDEIYEKYKNLVMKAAYQYSENYDVAEDITQNTFLQLYVYIDELEDTNIKSWMYTTAKHMALNYRKRSEREILPDTEEGIPEISELADSVEEAYMEKCLEEDKSRLHEEIFTELYDKNPRWYTAVRLVYYLEIPQSVVAEKMGIRIEVLHSLLYRAKIWIKKRFGTEYEELKQL